MSPPILLLLELALAFYAVGVIWAHEVDIFRTWALVDARQFHRVQQVHWRKVPYWVFAPVGLALTGSVALIWYHPAGSPAWGIWGALAFQLASHLLTMVFWGPWQAQLSRDDRGPESPYLAKILSTHWIRTSLITMYALTVLAWVVSLQT